MDLSPGRKGAIAEQALILAAVEAEIPVFRPIAEGGRSDLVMEIGGRLQRVQCKSGTCDGDVIVVHLSTCRFTPTRGYIRTTYESDEIDLFGVYCAELRRCYLLPIADFAGRTYAHLRTAPAKNNQQIGIRWAAEYEFAGAVAQLGERLAGSQKVRGSSPLSSITVGADTVGAHALRERVGHYMERAAAGEEIVVSRHGRPYIRLCPAVISDAA